MDNFMIGILLMLGFTFGSRAINDAANKKLALDKKAGLVELFSKLRAYSSVASIVLLLLFFGNTKYHLVTFEIGYLIFVIGFLILIFVSSKLSYTILTENDYPKSYIKSYIISVCVRYLGIVFFLGFIYFK